MIRTRETFISAEKNRARALAFIRANPGAVLADVMRHMDMEKERAAQLLLRMVNLKEITRLPGGKGHSGRPCAKHYAVAERTVSAEEIFAHLTGNLNGAGKGRVITRIAVAKRSMPEPRLFGGL